MLILYVAAGGAMGASLRYGCMHLMSGWVGKAFPYATLSVNILGSLLLGIMLGVLSDMLPRGKELYLLTCVGALGGFTTFSTFAMDSYVLLEKGQWLAAIAYISASVLLSIIAFVGGMALYRYGLSS